MIEAAENAPTRPGKNKKIALAFLLVAIIGAGVIYCSHRELRPPLGWIDDDLGEAMRLARQRSANVVVLFVAKPPSEAGRSLRDGTLSKGANTQALKDGNFVAVMVRVPPSRRSEIAGEFGVTAFPTTLILSPEGEELNRREGKIGQTDFRNRFLGEAMPR